MPLPGSATSSATSRLFTLVGLIIVVAALALAKDILVPFALAVLFSFLLSPLVGWIERHHLARVPAVLLVSALGFAAIGGVGYVVALQGIELTQRLPEYRDNIRSRVEALRSGETAITEAAETLEDIGKDITDGERAQAERVPRPGEVPASKPLPVEVVPPPVSPLEFLARTAGPVLDPLATAGMVLVLVVFMLLRREDLRDRFILLVGRSDPHVTMQALQEASRRVSRYLLMQLLVNSIYAVPVAIGLLLIGVPNALLWALLGLLLRFIPYVGPVTAAGLPIVLSLAVFEDWRHPLMVIGLYVVVELVINNAVEPWLYGSSTGISPVAVIVSAIFWTWLWGPVGLLMATPLTATLVAFGKHVPQIGFFHTLLGDDQVATTEWRFYQRLLAVDQEEAAEIAEDELEESESLLGVYDGVLLPALRMSEEDRHRGRIGEETSHFIGDSIAAIAEMLLERAPEPAEPVPGEAGEELCVLCVPARDRADAIAGRMLASVLSAWGCRAEALGAELLVSERVTAVERADPAVVCISAVPPSATAHARHLSMRLQRFARLAIVTCLWLSPVRHERARERVGSRDPDAVVMTFESAVAAVRRQAALRCGATRAESEAHERADAETAAPLAQPQTERSG